MVNLFEQWNDMDFVSTYEPIDWKALNDFANRARQDAKDNADALKAAQDDYKNNLVYDPDERYSDAMNSWYDDAVSSAASLSMNQAPGTYASQLAQINKRANAAASKRLQFSKNSETRNKNFASLGGDSRTLQIYDDITNRSGDFTDNSSLMTGATRAEKTMNDWSARKGHDQWATLSASEKSYSQYRAFDDVLSAESAVNEDVSDYAKWIMADLSANGVNSRFYNQWGDAFKVDSNGNFILDENGVVQFSDGYNGSQKLQDAAYEYDVANNGIKLRKDENGNLIRRSTGKDSFDKFTNSIKYAHIYNQIYRDRTAKQVSDGSSGRGKKNPSYDMSKTWTENANDNMRSGISTFSSDSGHYEYDDSKLILMNLVDQNGDKTPYYIYDENNGELALGSPGYLYQGGAAKKMWYDKETTDEDRFKILIAGNNDTSNGKYNPDNMGEWRFKANGRSSVVDASVIDRDAYESAGVTFEPTSTTKKRGDTDYSVIKNAKSLKIKSVGAGTFIVPATTPILNSKGIRGDETAVVINKETGDVSFRAGSGVLRNDNMVFNTLFLNKLAHKAADKGNMKATSEYVSSKFDKYENGSLGVSYTVTPKNMLEMLVEMKNSNPTNKNDVFAKNQAIEILNSITRNGRYDYEKLPSILKSCVDSDIVFNSKNRDEDRITFYASIPVSSTVDSRINDTASAITKKNAEKPEDLAQAHKSGD